MKRIIPILVVATLFICRTVLSQTPVPGAFTGASGNPLVNAKVIKFDGENFVVEHDGGISTVPWDRAPEAVRSKYTRKSAAVAPPTSVAPSPALSSPQVATEKSPARERKFARYNFAITFPDGWNPVNTPLGPTSFQMSFMSPDKKRLVAVAVDDRRKYSDTLDDYNISEYERGAQSRGSKPLWTKKSELAGKPCYIRRWVVSVSGIELPTLSLLVYESGVSYTLMAMCNDKGEPGEDAETHKFFSSLRFLTTASPAEP